MMKSSQQGIDHSHSKHDSLSSRNERESEKTYSQLMNDHRKQGLNQRHLQNNDTVSHLSKVFSKKSGFSEMPSQDSDASFDVTSQDIKSLDHFTMSDPKNRRGKALSANHAVKNIHKEYSPLKEKRSMSIPQKTSEASKNGRNDVKSISNDDV